MRPSLSGRRAGRGGGAAYRASRWPSFPGSRRLWHRRDGNTPEEGHHERAQADRRDGAVDEHDLRGRLQHGRAPWRHRARPAAVDDERRQGRHGVRAHERRDRDRRALPGDGAGRRDRLRLHDGLLLPGTRLGPGEARADGAGGRRAGGGHRAVGGGRAGAVRGAADLRRHAVPRLEQPAAARLSRGAGLRGAQRRRRAGGGSVGQPGHQRSEPGVGGRLRGARLPARGRRAALLLHGVALGRGGRRARAAHRQAGGDVQPGHDLDGAGRDRRHAADRPLPPALRAFRAPERPGKIFPVAQADDYTTGSIQVVDPESGKFDTLYDSCDGRRLCGPNDLVFDAAGGFWFTDLGKTRERDADRGAVYYANADGSSIREAIFPLERPNGIGLSPDGRTLYVVETPTARCWAFSLSAPGQIESANGPYRGEKGRVVVGLGGDQMFDSLAVHAESHVCVGTLITRAGSDTWPPGSRVDQFVLPDMMVTNVCFGGRELRTAFATLSMGGRLVSFEWPRPGLPLRYLNA